jgi:hypothetical protein
VLAASSEARPVVLLTDDPATRGWAISLPDDVGTVTRLASPPTPPPDLPPDLSPMGPPLAAQPGTVG